MQHVYGYTGNLGNECANHAAALGTFGLVPNHNLASRWVRHNFDTSACFLVLATTLETSWTTCVTLELKQHRYLTTGLSAVFLIGFSMTFTHALHHMLFALRPFYRAQPFTEPCCTLSEPWKAQFRVLLPLRVLVKVSHTTCGILCWSCYFTTRFAALSNRLLMKLTWLRSHSLAILLLICSAARKAFTILHDASSGTIAHAVYFLVWHHCHYCDTEILFFCYLEQSQPDFGILLAAENEHTHSPSTWVASIYVHASLLA